MVGTPKSTGCDTCRKRKKKCGEERPECLACVAAGWKCPGFIKRWKFVDESQQLVSHYKKKKYGLEDLELMVTSGSKWIQNSQADALDYQKRNIRAVKSSFIIFPALSSNQQQHHNISTLVYMLNDPKSQRLFPIGALGTFFNFIPSRLGRNLALDDTISCLCGLYTDILTEKSTISDSAIRSYAKSLNSLRVCLEEPDLRTESETICASIILQLCELLTNSDNGRWNHLSRGSKLLIRDKGSEGFEDPFDRSMLDSQRAFFIIQDMYAGQDCFLSEPKWRNHLQPSNGSSTGPQPISLRSELCNLLVDIPKLVSDASNLSIPTKSPFCDQYNLENRHICVLLRAISIYDGIESWYETQLKPLLADCDSTRIPTPSSNEIASDLSIENPERSSDYSHILLAVLDCVSNSVLIKLQSLLLALASKSPQHSENLKFETCPSRMAKRERIVHETYAFVSRNSKTAAKPLEFGLQQIWSIDFVANYLSTT